MTAARRTQLNPATLFAADSAGTVSSTRNAPNVLFSLRLGSSRTHNDSSGTKLTPPPPPFFLVCQMTCPNRGCRRSVSLCPCMLHDCILRKIPSQGVYQIPCSHRVGESNQTFRGGSTPSLAQHHELCIYQIFLLISAGWPTMVMLSSRGAIRSVAP